MSTDPHVIVKFTSGIPVQKSNVTSLRTLIALLCLKRFIAELPLRAGLIRTS